MFQNFVKISDCEEYPPDFSWLTFIRLWTRNIAKVVCNNYRTQYKKAVYNFYARTDHTQL